MAKNKHITFENSHVKLQGTREEIERSLDLLIRANPEAWSILRSVVGNYQAELVRFEMRNGYKRKLIQYVQPDKKQS